MDRHGRFPKAGREWPRIACGDHGLNLARSNQYGYLGRAKFEGVLQFQIDAALFDKALLRGQHYL